MTDFNDYSRHYFEQYREGEFETVIAEVRRRHVLETVARFPHRTILEIGCGVAPLFPDIADYDDYYAVEPQPQAVEAVRARAAALPSVRILEGLLEDKANELPRRFDLVVASSLLHEVPDAAAFLAAIAGHCDGGTVVHLNVPNVRSFHRLLAVEAGMIGDVFEKSAAEERFQRQRRFDRDTLLAFVEANGFRVLESATYFVKPFTHAQMAAMLSHQIIDERVIAALDRMTRYLPELGSEMYVNMQLA